MKKPRPSAMREVRQGSASSSREETVPEEPVPATTASTQANLSQDGPGRVYLVGAGPGDPGLITWRGVQVLRRATLVLYDYLANESLLDHVPATAERICLGRHGRSTLWSQDAIQARLVQAAQQGHTVVRLKGGDAGIFGRLAEELAALEAAGITYEVVPGVTAALAAPAYAGIPLTERSVASAVAFVTAHEDEAKQPRQVDYAALARFPGTLVFYMGVTEVDQWTESLLAHGKAPQTPVALIRHVSRPNQQVTVCSLAEVQACVAGPPKMRPPVLFVCGDVVARSQEFSWFQRRPLHGVRVLVTRPAHQQADLADLLAERGADVVASPAICIEPLEDWSAVDNAWQRLTDFAWIVFSSANGVRAWCDRIWETGQDFRGLQTVKIAAIGPGTERQLATYHLRADLVPPEYRAESLGEALLPHVAGQRCLLIRASRGREVLAEMLQGAGADVHQVVAYRSEDVAAVSHEIEADVRQGGVHWITVTSSAIARSLHQQWGAGLQRVRLASISPITSDTLRSLGLEPAAEATTYTMAGLVAAMELAEQARPSPPAAALPAASASASAGTEPPPV